MVNDHGQYDDFSAVGERLGAGGMGVSLTARLLLLALLVSVPLHAQAPPPAQTPPPTPVEAPIARWEVPLTIAGVVTEFATSALFAPASCRWCETTPSGADAVNGLDRSTRNALRWSDANVGEANALSDVTEYAPLAVALIHRDLDGRGILTVTQAVTTAALIAEITKVVAARERPSYHYRLPGTTAQPMDRNESFVSGHTAEAFAMVVATTRVAASRGRKTRWLWISGLSLAVATGYLRIAADQHYLTDVLAGAGVGIAAGYAVPALHGGRSAKRPSIAAFGGAHGGQFLATWRWGR
jgi:membrane-associated phospholipid phosphatase